MGKIAGNEIIERIIHFRRDLHRNPELSFQEKKTTENIASVLENEGLILNSFSTLDTGGYCDIGDKGEIICFRSDIDALPITENDSHEIKSLTPGIMHACGHDYHTALGLGLLLHFNNSGKRMNKRLRVIFQPGEEAAPGGAEYVDREDIWDDVKYVITTHVSPDVKAGNFVVNKGAVQSSSTQVKIIFRGKGGHTSRPDETEDLILIAAHFITQLKSFISGFADPRKTIVLAFGTISAGDTHNIIPDELLLRGTLRTFDNELLTNILPAIRKFAEKFAHSYGLEISVEYPTSCPATVNSEILVNSYLNYMEAAGKTDKAFISDIPSMGADDFAFYSRRFPALYLISGGEGKGNLHSSILELDEGLLPETFNMLTGFMEKLLDEK